MFTGQYRRIRTRREHGKPSDRIFNDACLEFALGSRRQDDAARLDVNVKRITGVDAELQPKRPWKNDLTSGGDARFHSKTILSHRLTESALRFVEASGVGGVEVCVDVGYNVGEEVELAAEGLDFGFGAAVDFEVEFAADAVFVVLAVLAHHDDRCLNRG